MKNSRIHISLGALFVGVILSLAILSLAVSAPAFAQAAAGAALTGTYRIAGRVVNALTGEPVRGAQVELLTAEDSRTFASVESGEDGRFDVEHLPGAKFQLTASKRGYCTSFYDEHEEYSSAIVTGEGQETGNLVLKLTPGGVLDGVVTDDGGDPVENATVMLFKEPRNHEPDAKVERSDTAATDDTGAYEFANLQPGEYLVAVQAQPWYALNRLPGTRQETEAEAALDVAYPVTFFDSTTDQSSASPILLAGGSRQQANISLHAVPAVHLDVQAQKQDGADAAPTQLQETVFGIPIGGAPALRHPTAEGIELAGLAPGQYVLTQGDHVLTLNAVTSQQVDPNAGVPTVTVNGVLQPAPGTTLTGRELLELEPAGGAVEAPIAQSSFNRGGFSFQSVPPGAWTLRVQGPDGVLQVISISNGGRTQAGNRITVQDRPLSLVVRVSAHPVRVEGFVRAETNLASSSSAEPAPAKPKDVRGVGGAMVVLVPRDTSAVADLGRRDQSNSDGSFALLDVAPGEYTVVAIENGWDLDWWSPAVIARYLPGGVAVTVTDSRDNEPDRRVTISQPVIAQPR